MVWWFNISDAVCSKKNEPRKQEANEENQIRHSIQAYTRQNIRVHMKVSFAFPSSRCKSTIYLNKRLTTSINSLTNWVLCLTAQTFPPECCLCMLSCKWMNVFAHLRLLCVRMRVSLSQFSLPLRYLSLSVSLWLAHTDCADPDIKFGEQNKHTHEKLHHMCQTKAEILDEMGWS